MQYLLNQLHFKATFLTGKTIKGRKDKHAINMIKYDNDYYYIDATWGDLGIRWWGNSSIIIFDVWICQTIETNW